MVQVSIVVPVYNVERYLHQCVESILKQTLQDIEVILVDDGSPDSCGEICDAYAKKDNRIKVVHQKNRGLSGARNTGMQNATGKYIGFVDSDDFIESNMYEELYQTAEQQHVDFVMCDYCKDLENTHVPIESSIEAGEYDVERIRNEIYPQLIMREMVDYGPLLSVCKCLYRLDFIVKNRITFNEHVRLSEDCLFSACIGLFADRFYYLKGRVLYHYRFNPNSLSHSFKDYAWQSFCLMNDEFRRIFSGMNYDFSRQFNLHMLYYTLNMLRQLKSTSSSFREKWIALREVLHTPQVLRAMKGFRIPVVSIKLRIVIGLVKYRAALLLTLIGK